MATKGSRNM